MSLRFFTYQKHNTYKTEASTLVFHALINKASIDRYDENSVGCGECDSTREEVEEWATVRCPESVHL